MSVGMGHKGASGRNAGILSAVTVLTSYRVGLIGGTGRHASSIILNQARDNSEHLSKHCKTFQNFLLVLVAYHLSWAFGSYNRWEKLTGETREGASHLTIFIRRVTLNTELDTVCLFVWHGQMTHFWVCSLVCPFSIWLGQGFYVELFSINSFAPEYPAKMKRTFRLE